MTEIERLLLRRWRDGDFNACAPLRRFGSDALHRRERPTHLGQREEQIAWFVRHWEEHGFGLWAIGEKASSVFVGLVGLNYRVDWTEDEHKTEVGWRLDRAHWGRGLATEGAVANVRYGFESLDLEHIISIIQPANVASRLVAGKAGLTARGETR